MIVNLLVTLLSLSSAAETKTAAQLQLPKAPAILQACMNCHAANNELKYTSARAVADRQLIPSYQYPAPVIPFDEPLKLRDFLREVRHLASPKGQIPFSRLDTIRGNTHPRADADVRMPFGKPALKAQERKDLLDYLMKIQQLK